MQEKSCRCGERKKRFKFDIGEFFVDTCCEAKGYDALGNLKGAPATPAEMKQLQKAMEVGPTVSQPLQIDDRLSKPMELEVEAPEAQEPEVPGPNEGEAPEAAPGDSGLLQKFFGRAGGRGKLMDMKIEDLKAKAQAKGVVGFETMTKKQLVAELLK